MKDADEIPEAFFEFCDELDVDNSAWHIRRAVYVSLWESEGRERVAFEVARGER